MRVYEVNHRDKLSNSQRLKPFHLLVTLSPTCFGKLWKRLAGCFSPNAAAWCCRVLLPDVDGGWALAPLQGAAVRCLSLWPMACQPPLRQTTIPSTMSATKNTTTTSGILNVHLVRRASRAPEVGPERSGPEGSNLALELGSPLLSVRRHKLLLPRLLPLH